ncbi:unnamed protein product [Mytilus edulis]|uniref:Uncharacterized protein n=1 Tax=Mytilus edulis TaxID=6550 RepID=A0A8S3V2B6_MYTED|nr:unnamed protein product [Mytilus edulis]
MGANCGKKCKSSKKQQRKEIYMIRFVQRLRNLFNKNRVVPFSEPSVSNVISNTTVISQNNQNKSRRLSMEERKCQTALNKPCIDLNPTPLLNNVEFINDDLPSAKDNMNRLRDFQGKGGETNEANEKETISLRDIQGKVVETKEANEKETIGDINICDAIFEKDVDEILNGTIDTLDRRLRPKAAKGVRTRQSMTIMFAANSNMDVSLPGEVIPSSNTSKVSRPQLTAPELPTKEKVYLDSWIEFQIKKDNLKK